MYYATKLLQGSVPADWRAAAAVKSYYASHHTPVASGIVSLFAVCHRVEQVASISCNHAPVAPDKLHLCVCFELNYVNSGTHALAAPDYGCFYLLRFITMLVSLSRLFAAHSFLWIIN